MFHIKMVDFELLRCRKCWYSKAGLRSNLHLRGKTGRRAFIDRAKCFHASCPSNAYFLIPLRLKEFLQFVRRWEAERERKWGDKLTESERKREAERYWMYSPPCFSSLLAPRGFSKAFSEKTSGCAMDQTAAAATFQPTQQTTSFDISVTISPHVASVLYTAR